ncbi:MAG: hypothetical protein ROO76_17935 [Terriglobia bacterium]|nr:hypothetical protein [Terriglobia bacterium]
MKFYAGQHAYPIVLAVIAAAILVGGFLLKPSPRKTESKTAYDFTTIMGEVSRLREIAQRNSFRSTSARFNAAAMCHRRRSPTQGDYPVQAVMHVAQHRSRQETA